MAPKIKRRAEVKLINSKGRILVDTFRKHNMQEGADLHTWGAYLRVPVPTKVDQSVKYAVEATYLGEHQYKQTYEQCVKAHKKN